MTERPFLPMHAFEGYSDDELNTLAKTFAARAVLLQIHARVGYDGAQPQTDVPLSAAAALALSEADAQCLVHVTAELKRRAALPHA